MCATNAYAADAQPLIVSVGVDESTMTVQAWSPVGETLVSACFVGLDICVDLPAAASCKPAPDGCTYTFAVPQDDLLHGKVCVSVMDAADAKSECTTITLP